MTFINKDKTLCFVHVPKTGGRSITDFLTQQIAEPGLSEGFSMKEYRHLSGNPYASEGHIPYHHIKKEFPEACQNWSAFAVIRHPVERAMSAFKHHNPVHGSCRSSLSRWVNEMEKKSSTSEWEKFSWWDAYKSGMRCITTHFVPQSFFVDETDDITLFSFDNLPTVPEWIKQQLLKKGSQPSRIYADRKIKHIGKSHPGYDLEFNPDEITRLEEIYSEDFKLWSKARR